MKNSNSYRWTTNAIVLILMAMLTGTPAWATTHVVKFGGSAGFKYVPASFSAAVGDTVAWEGDFSVHPLSSTTIPAGSPSWHVATGSRFTYVLKGQGAFNYKCDLHSGMTGSFQSGMTGIGSSVVRRDETAQAPVTMLVSSASGRPSLQINVPHAGSVAVRIVDLHGRVLTSVASQVVRRGLNILPFTGMKTGGLFRIIVTFNVKETFGTFVVVL